MTIDDLQSKYQQVRQSRSFAERQAFIKELLSDQSEQAVAFHFDLLKQRENRDLYEELRAAFVKRGPSVESLLADRVDSEADPVARGDALQLLGTLRSESAPRLARRLLNAESEELRYKAIIVLGWTGARDDVGLLAKVITEDTSPRLRGFAGTALRQLYLRLPDFKEQVTQRLLGAIKAETVAEALTGLIIAFQTVVGKSFGLRERISEGTVTGDPFAAKTKVLKHFH